MTEQMVVDPEVKDDPSTQADPEAKDDPKPEATDQTQTPLAGKSKSGDLPKWLYSVPEPLRDDLKEYSSSSEAWSALADLRGRAQRSIELPDKDATPEQIAEFHKKLGRPQGPEGYGLAKPADWPESIPWTESIVRTFAQNAFAAGLTGMQAKELFAQDAANAVRMYKAAADKRAEQRKQGLSMLKEMADKAIPTGAPEEKMAEFVKQSEQAIRTVGSPELLALLRQHGLHDNPLVIQSYQRAYNAVKDDKFFRSHEAEVQSQITEEPWRKIYGPKTQV